MQVFFFVCFEHDKYLCEEKSRRKTKTRVVQLQNIFCAMTGRKWMRLNFRMKAEDTVMNLSNWIFR